MDEPRCRFCGKPLPTRVSRRVHGVCYACRWRVAEQRRRITVHPAIDWDDRRVNERGTQLVAVTCPGCGDKRYAQPGWVVRNAAAGTFTGKCRRCAKVTTGQVVFKAGYVGFTRTGCPPELLPYFDAMRTKASFVLEHRLVMAAKLGRALESWELVDHMDGDPANNAPENLRLYRRGRNEPGSANGWGTYYHEWQMAEAEIRRLKARR